MDNFFKIWGGRREAGSIPKTTDPGDASNQGPMAADWSANIVTPNGRRSLLVPAWYRGVTLLMQTMGQMVVQYQKLNAEGGNFVEDRWGTGRNLNYLLQVRPNPLMTASQMQEQIVYRKIYYGNAFVYIERNEFGDPVALWLCTSGGYNPVTDSYTLTYNRPGGTDINVSVPSADVLHFKNTILTDDMYMGMPVIKFALKSLEIAATADEQALQGVAKGGRHKVLLQEAKEPKLGTRGRANATQLKKMRDQFSSDWASSDVVMLDNVADAKIISQTASELQLLEQRNYQVSDLARLLGVPRIMMMDDQGASYKMPEHATQEFLLRTIQPKVRADEDEYNSKLLRREEFGRRRIHVCEQALRRLDAKGQAEIYKMLLECGVYSPDELRNMYDLPTIENGNVHYVSTNLAVVGSPKLSGEDPNEQPAQEGGEA